MIRRPPRTTRTDTLVPYTTVFRSLEQAYEGLPKTGFGRIAVLEAAMTEDKPVLWAIRADGKPAIALAAPARAGETLAGIALVRLPLEMGRASGRGRGGT